MISKRELDQIKHALDVSLEYNKRRNYNASIEILFDPETAKSLYHFLNSVDEVRCEHIIDRETAKYIPECDMMKIVKYETATKMVKYLEENDCIAYLTNYDHGEQRVQGRLFIVKPDKKESNDEK